LKPPSPVPEKAISRCHFSRVEDALTVGSYLKVHSWRRGLAVRYLSSNESSFPGKTLHHVESVTCAHAP
jgi:hypothetical protein